MNLTEKQRQEIIPELEYIQDKVKDVEKELYRLVEQFNNDVVTAPASQAAGKFASTLGSALYELKIAGRQYIKDYVTVWYKSLHYDMSEPLVEIPEEDIRPPVYESVNYLGNNEYEIIMQTQTHGRERVIVHSNSASWCEVYSADKVI